MSLINQVLRDLDRRARPSDRLPTAVRAVAAVRVRWSRQQVTAAAMAGLLALCVVAWLRVRSPTAPPHVPADAAMSTAVAAPMPAPVHVAMPMLGTPALMDRAALPIAVLPAPSSPFEPPVEQRVTATSQPVHAASVARRSSLGSFTAPLRIDASATEADSDSSRDRRELVATANVAGPRSALLMDGDSPVPAAPPTRIEKRHPPAGPVERGEAAYRLGVDAQQRGDDATAEKQYLAALRDDASLASARIGLAGIRMAQGRPIDAEEALQAGLARNPQQVALAVPLAKLLAARGELSAAIDVLQAGLPGAAASNADYRATYGAVLQRAGQHHDAAEQFSAALRLDPGNGVWWMGLAISLGADSRTDAARSAYKQALATGGLSPELAQFVEQRLRQLL